MREIKISFSFFFVFAFSLSLYSQQKINTTLNLIVTYEVQSNKGIHGTQRYFWILPSDSVIAGRQSSLSPFYVEGFSRNQLERCEKGLEAYMFLYFNDSDFNFEKKYIESNQKLVNMIFDNRKLVQTIIKKWPNKFKQTIRVYLTPIRGAFCQCAMADESGRLINYKGTMFLPINEHSVEQNFWSSDIWKNKLVNDFTLTTINNVAYSGG